MNIPDKVRIDGIEYEIVKYNEPLTNDDYKLVYGEIDYRRCLIRLDVRMNNLINDNPEMFEKETRGPFMTTKEFIKRNEEIAELMKK